MSKRRPSQPDWSSVHRNLSALYDSPAFASTNLLAGIGGFDRQIRPLTTMFRDERQRAGLLAGIAGVDASQRAVLTTAIGARQSTFLAGIDYEGFTGGVSKALGDLAATQMSVGAKQSLLGKSFSLPALTGLQSAASFDAYKRLNGSFLNAFQASAKAGALAGMGQHLRNQLAGFAGGAWVLANLRQEIDEEALAFVERHGWPLPLALPVSAVKRLTRLTPRGKREVQALMVRSFSHRTKAYRLSRDRLLDSPHFASRRPPIEQALRALNHGHYYASINTMLPLVEGVLVDTVLADDPPEHGAPKKAMAALQDATDEFDAVLVQSVETLLISVTSGAALFSHFDRHDYGGAGESRRLNRHAILHGSARRYGTQANALKLFLLLVALAEVLELREELDEHAEPDE